jgi:hypothetical protein
MRNLSTSRPEIAIATLPLQPAHAETVCGISVVACKVKCKESGKMCVGSTQQFFKNCMRGHFQDVKQFVEKGTLSDSHAHQWCQVEQTPPTPGIQRSFATCSIIWKGDPLSVVKMLGRNSCKLCNRERMVIAKAEHKSPRGLINSR